MSSAPVGSTQLWMATLLPEGWVEADCRHQGSRLLGAWSEVMVRLSGHSAGHGEPLESGHCALWAQVGTTHHWEVGI